ncbi:MAG TPA: hypothetical protein VGD01_19615 [Candidatus Elarobacter sp.]
MKTILSFAMVALLAGCSGGATSVPTPSNPISVTAPAATVRAPQSGGPGTTSVTYYDTYAPVGPCTPHELTILAGGSFPVTHLDFAAGDGPPLIVSNCNFQTPQYVRVTLSKIQYGAPFIRQVDYTVTVDAPGPAQVTATWVALGPTLPGHPGLKGKVTFTISAPSGGGGL